jgi:thiaminase (transcriptional activator TenA)
MSTTITAPSERFRSQSDRIWEQLHAHPFITELAEGTLPLDKFRFFIEQDNMYLEEYARCLAMGAAKSRTEQETRHFVDHLNQNLDAEIPTNHRLLAKAIELGAEDRGGSQTMTPANMAYTGYMRRLSITGGPLEILASLLPCAWSYTEIADRLRHSTDSAHPVYGEWIAHFAGPESKATVDEMRSDFDRLVLHEAHTEDRQRAIGEIFATSSRLELMFWQMAYTMDQWADVPTTA